MTGLSALDRVAAAARSIEQGLVEKGFTRASTRPADFLVLHQIGFEHKLDVRTVNAPYRGGTSEWEIHRTVREEVVVEQPLRGR